jgi:lipopolysaccharide transport system ATP-binding protein
MTPAIEVQGLSKRYRLYRRRHQSIKEILVRRSLGEWEDLWALRDVSFAVPQGQTLGVIGENGSGKSTLLKLLVGILQPDAGTISARGRVSSLLELGAGFEPEYTGRENVYLYGALLGLRRREVSDRFDEILAFSELGDFIEYPVKNYSSGMYMRLGFSVAVHLRPDILLIDEILAVGDTGFQQKCFQHLNTLRRGGCTVVLVSHDLESVARFCDRAIWLDRGHLRADGPTEPTIEDYIETTSRRAVTERPATIAGGEQVRIVDVRFIGPDNESRRIFQSREPLTVEIEYEAAEAIANGAINFTIFRADGIRVLDAPTVGAFDMDRGRHVARLHFPALNIHRGSYRASISIWHPETRRTFEFHDQAYPFRVQDPHHDPFHGNALVWVDYDWDVEPRMRGMRASG